MSSYVSFFIFNDTATTEIYTLSLHDALPISVVAVSLVQNLFFCWIPVKFLARPVRLRRHDAGDRMSEAIVHGRDGLLPRTHALEPVRHVLDGHVIDGHRRQFLVARQLNVSRL